MLCFEGTIMFGSPTKKTWLNSFPARQASANKNLKRSQ